MRMWRVWVGFSVSVLLCIVGCQRSGERYNGYIEGKYTYVSTPISARMTSLLVTKGQMIKAGQLVAVLDQQPLVDDLKATQFKLDQLRAQLKNLLTGSREAELKQLHANVKGAKARLRYANIQTRRFTTLVESKNTDQRSLDEAIVNADSALAAYNSAVAALAHAKLPARQHEIIAAEAAVRAGQANLQKATWWLKQTQVISTVSGIVTNRYYHTGEWVPMNHPIISLQSKKNIKALFFLPQRHLSQLRLMQPVWLHREGLAKPIKAKVVFISPRAEFTPPVIYSSSSKNKLVYRIEAAIDNPDVVVHPGQVIEVSMKRAG